MQGRRYETMAIVLRAPAQEKRLSQIGLAGVFSGDGICRAFFLLLKEGTEPIV